MDFYIFQDSFTFFVHFVRELFGSRSGVARGSRAGSFGVVRGRSGVVRESFGSRAAAVPWPSAGRCGWVLQLVPTSCTNCSKRRMFFSGNICTFWYEFSQSSGAGSVALKISRGVERPREKRGRAGEKGAENEAKDPSESRTREKSGRAERNERRQAKDR